MEELRKKFRQIKHMQKHKNSLGGSNTPPFRSEHSHTHVHYRNTADQSEVTVLDGHMPTIYLVEPGEALDHSPGVDVIPDALDNDTSDGNLFTRNEGNRGAFKAEWVQEVLRQVKIGNDL